MLRLLYRPRNARDRLGIDFFNIKCKILTAVMMSVVVNHFNAYFEANIPVRKHPKVFLSRNSLTPLAITYETLEVVESRFLRILFCFHSSSSNSQTSTNTAVYTQQSIKGTYEAGSKNGIFTTALESATGCFFFLGFYT